MSNLGNLGKGKSMILTVIVVLVIVAAIGTPMLAYFTSTATTSGTFGSGKLELTFDPNNVFAYSNLAPKPDTKWEPSETRTIKNTGTLTVKFKLTAAKVSGDENLYEKMDCRIKKGSATLYEGALNALSLESTAVGFGLTDGLMDAGSNIPLTFEFRLNKSAKNMEQDKKIAFELVLNGTNPDNPGYEE